MKHTAPQDFLCIIKNAKYVVTDSFHGTAFSIIFEKQFVSVNDRLKQGQLKYDERICCLLSSLGLQCRYITKEMISSFNIEESIDYQAIRKRQLLLLSSEKWLMDALQKGDYNED